MFTIHQSDSGIKHGVIIVALKEIIRTSCRCLVGKAKGKYNSEDPGKTKNSVDLIRKLTIPTERPPLVGEVSANLS
jgi:hypothetical protein